MSGRPGRQPLPWPRRDCNRQPSPVLDPPCSARRRASTALSRRRQMDARPRARGRSMGCQRHHLVPVRPFEAVVPPAAARPSSNSRDRHKLSLGINAGSCSGQLTAPVNPVERRCRFRGASTRSASRTCSAWFRGSAPQGRLLRRGGSRHRTLPASRLRPRRRGRAPSQRLAFHAVRCPQAAMRTSPAVEQVAALAIEPGAACLAGGGVFDSCNPCWRQPDRGRPP
jgi:hypothetical protein